MFQDNCDSLRTFIEESNKIEGIFRDVTKDEYKAYEIFLDLDSIYPEDLQRLVSATQPGAILRDRAGLNVYIGAHVPEPGGEEVVKQLTEILRKSNCRYWTPWEVHNAYENLHPFTDGNGRSGRALWLWCHRGRVPEIGFLHTYYYETLHNLV